MRFLHTADWHVGRTIRGRSRIDEFEEALATVVEVARDQKVDFVLVAGDIHDQRAVTPDADRLIFETFISLHSAGIPVVAIPGNHDSAARLAAFAPLLDHIGTRVVAKMRHPENGGMVEIGSRDGTGTALIACIPFVSPRRFANAADEFESIATGYVNFDESMGLLLDTFEGSFRKDAVNVVMGHMFVAGAQPSGSEREVTVGAEYAVSAARLPTTCNYIALGHIHKPQKVKGAAAETRYSGSLIQLDFGERGQEKSLVVVEARPGKPPKTETVPIDGGSEADRGQRHARRARPAPRSGRERVRARQPLHRIARTRHRRSGARGSSECFGHKAGPARVRGAAHPPVDARPRSTRTVRVLLRDDP